MKYMFPYNLVKKDSRIIIYGEGEIGREFYLQLYYSGYCVVVAWVDKAFDMYRVEKPFDQLENILHYDFDYIVIALDNSVDVSSVKNSLLDMGIDKEKII